MGEIKSRDAADKQQKSGKPYYRLYTLLFEAPRYSSMQLESMVLYSMLLSRVSLSEKNGWRDEKQRVFVYCTVDEVGNFLRCGRDKAMKTLRELENTA